MAAAVISPTASTAGSLVPFSAHSRTQPLAFDWSHLPDQGIINARLDEFQSELARRVSELALEFLHAAGRISPPLSLPVQLEGLPLPSFPAGLRRPLDGMLTLEDDEFVVEVPELGIVVSSPSRDGIVDALGEQLDALAAHYLSLDDSQLTPGGKAMKETLRALVDG